MHKNVEKALPCVNQAMEDKVEQAEHAKEAAQQRARDAALAAKSTEADAAEAASKFREAHAAADRAAAEALQLNERLGEYKSENGRIKEQMREQASAAEAAVRAARTEKERLLALHKRRVSRVASQVRIHSHSFTRTLFKAWVPAEEFYGTGAPSNRISIFLDCHRTEEPANNTCPLMGARAD